MLPHCNNVHQQQSFLNSFRCSGTLKNPSAVDPARQEKQSLRHSVARKQVIATVFGPREVQNRSEALHDRALIKCEYSMAAFSTGERRK